MACQAVRGTRPRGAARAGANALGSCSENAHVAAAACEGRSRADGERYVILGRLGVNGILTGGAGTAGSCQIAAHVAASAWRGQWGGKVGEAGLESAGCPYDWGHGRLGSLGHGSMRGQDVESSGKDKNALRLPGCALHGHQLHLPCQAPVITPILIHYAHATVSPNPDSS